MAKAIIFLHGIVESNYSFNYLIKDFKDYDKHLLTLPGHDGDALNFGRHNLLDWSNYVKNYILDLKDKYDEVIAIGHSMGGLLLLDFKNKYPNIIKKVITLALPLKIRPKIKAMIRSIRVAFKLYKKDNLKFLEYKKYYAIKPTRNIFAYYRWPLRYLDLFKLSRRIRKNIKDMTDILIINSKSDEMVSYKINKYLNPNIKLILINNSAHTLYDDLEKEEIIKKIANFIK